MKAPDERHRDIVDHCDALLARLAGHVQSDDTAEGRLIAQLNWLKERAADASLALPVDPSLTSTLRYVYTDGSIAHLFSSHEGYVNEVEVFLRRLLKLVKGELLLKAEYYPYAARCIAELVRVLVNAPRRLSAHEQGSIAELGQLAAQLRSGTIEPPLMSWKDYPNLRKVYRIADSTVDDLPNGKILCSLVTDMMFEGVRPQSWTTPELADGKTSAFA